MPTTIVFNTANYTIFQCGCTGELFVASPNRIFPSYFCSIRRCFGLPDFIARLVDSGNEFILLCFVFCVLKFILVRRAQATRACNASSNYNWIMDGKVGDIFHFSGIMHLYF